MQGVLMKLAKRYRVVAEERIRLSERFQSRLRLLRSEFEIARNNHLGNDIRDVADEGVLALTSLAEFVAIQHVALVRKKGVVEDARDHWLQFVHQEMEILYAACASAVIETSWPLQARHEGVVKAPIDFLNDQSRSYIQTLEQKLALESEPKDARTLIERLLAVVARTSDSGDPSLSQRC